MKVALFDFCNTLVNFSTADAYILYILNHLDEREKLQRTRKHRILTKTRIVWLYDTMISRGILKNRVYLNKRLYLESVRGLSYSDMDRYAKDYYEKCIRSHLIKETIAELKQKQDAGFNIGIVSGGYDMYLKYFAEEYHIPDLICTHIEFEDGKATGRIAGTDCMDIRKVELIEEHYKGKNIEKDGSYVYSDSRSDLPILKWAGNGIVVTRKIKVGWAVENGLRCLVWEDFQN